MIRLYLAMLCLLATLPGVALAQDAATRQPALDDLLCANAPEGTVEPLPDLVADWAMILCTSDGQALAPPEGDTQTLWLHQDTASPFLLYAAPKGALAEAPVGIGMYDLRFDRFAAAPIPEARRAQALDIWKQAFGREEVPADLGAIVQLDAASRFAGQVYSLFFFLREDEPRWLMACTGGCALAVPLDVLSGAELDSRLEAAR